MTIADLATAFALTYAVATPALQMMVGDGVRKTLGAVSPVMICGAVLLELVLAASGPTCPAPVNTTLFGVAIIAFPVTRDWLSVVPVAKID